MSLEGNARSNNRVVGKLGSLSTIHGKSAYEIAVMNGFDGTEAEWLESIKGKVDEQVYINEAERQKMWNNIQENPKIWELDSGIYRVSGNIYISETGQKFGPFEKTILVITKYRTNFTGFVLFFPYNTPTERWAAAGKTDGTTYTWHYSETTNNKVGTVDEKSTITQYPSAKAVYDLVLNESSKFQTAEDERQAAEDDRQAMWNNCVENPKVWELNPGCYYASGIVAIDPDAMFYVHDKTLLYVSKDAEDDTKKRFVLFLAYAQEIPYEIITGTTDGTISEWYGIETIKNRVKEINESSTHEQYPSAKAVYDFFNGMLVLSSDYFQNGSLVSGSDIAYAIVLKKPIPVSSGDLIKVAPGNGYKVWYKLVNSEDLSVALNIYNGGNTAEEREYTATQDGWLVVQVSRVDGAKMTPADYCCDISITNRKDDMEILTEVDVEAGHSNNQVYGAKAIDETLSAVDEALQIKQEALVSGENIKTINGQSVLGEGDIVVEGGTTENVVPSANLATNPKRKTFTTIVNDCQNASDWEIANTSSDILSVDTANYILGTQSLHSDNQMKCTKNQYDLLNNDLVVKIKVNSIEIGARLHLCVGSSFSGASNMVKYELARGCKWTTPSDWQEIAIPYAGTGYLNAPLDSIDFSKVDILTFNTEGGSADWNLQYVGTRPKTLSKGIITFTFDDGWDSQYTGVKLLAEKGITSTIFCIKEAVESGNYLTLEDFKKLVDYYGTDIEVHGDPSYDKWEEEDLKTHWSESQQFLKENGLGEGKHMAYPNGKYPENVVQLAKGYFDSCRTITPFIPLETYPLADRYRVRAVSGVGASNVTVNTVKKYIDRAMASGAWLILVFHKIGDGSDSMYCSESELSEIADYAIASGAYIMNYAEVMESSVVNTSLGNISKALDGIIDIQNNLIGGAEG